MKAYIVSLGCPKNLTDTEVLMGKLVASSHQIVNSPAKADTIIINTCAFLKSAREESIQTIREMKKYGKKLYVAGCLPKWMNKFKPSPAGTIPSPLSQRERVLHRKAPRNSLSPWERGASFTSAGEGIDGIIDSVGLFNYCTPRIKATPPWYAYVKIAEGCNNRCSYCLVPTIRGKLQLRKASDILTEVEQLARRGVKEIIYVAQDTTAYPNFTTLLKTTARIRGIKWIRIMYAHPAHVTEKFLDAIAGEKKIVKYLDLPIQHGSDRILRLMKRRYTRQDLENLIAKIRRRKIALRTKERLRAKRGGGF